MLIGAQRRMVGCCAKGGRDLSGSAKFWAPLVVVRECDVLMGVVEDRGERWGARCVWQLGMGNSIAAS